MAGNFKMNTKDFIEKAIKIHGYEYDYSLVNYINTSKKVIIICKTHGPFEQTPNCHLRKRGCPDCYGNIKYTNETFINRCEEVWGKDIHDKYDFSLIDYKNNKTKIKIFCKKHNGIFEQRPDMFLQKHGCDICGGTFKSNTKNFVKKSIEIHGNRYDYSKVDYDGVYTKIEIRCVEHGFFKQTPNSHLNGCGCPICDFSNGESKIENFLNINKINYSSQHKFEECKFKNSLPFDFYLPDKNICIEYDGIQHHKPIDYFGGEVSFKLNKMKDEIKNSYCEKNNIKLIRIPYENFKNMENELKMIFSI